MEGGGIGFVHYLSIRLRKAMKALNQHNRVTFENKPRPFSVFGLKHAAPCSVIGNGLNEGKSFGTLKCVISVMSAFNA